MPGRVAGHLVCLGPGRRCGSAWGRDHRSRRARRLGGSRICGLRGSRRGTLGSSLGLRRLSGRLGLSRRSRRHRRDGSQVKPRKDETSRDDQDVPFAKSRNDRCAHRTASICAQFACEQKSDRRGDRLDLGLGRIVEARLGFRRGPVCIELTTNIACGSWMNPRSMLHSSRLPRLKRPGSHLRMTG